MAQTYAQTGNSGRYAVWLQVGTIGRPTIGRSDAFDMSAPIGFQPLGKARLEQMIAPAAFRIAKDVDGTVAPTFAVVSSKTRIPVLYVRSTSAQGLRAVLSGLLTFSSQTGYRLRVLAINEAAGKAVTVNPVIRKLLEGMAS